MGGKAGTATSVKRRGGLTLTRSEQSTRQAIRIVAQYTADDIRYAPEWRRLALPHWHCHGRVSSQCTDVSTGMEHIMKVQVYTHPG